MSPMNFMLDNLRVITLARPRNISSVLIVMLLPSLLSPALHAAPLGRLFFTPEQRSQLEHTRARSTPASDRSTSSLVVNGIVQRHGGPRTAWINGVPRKAGDSDELNPNALPVAVPGKSQPVKIKVGQRLQLDQPAVTDVQNQNP